MEEPQLQKPSTPVKRHHILDSYNCRVCSKQRLVCPSASRTVNMNQSFSHPINQSEGSRSRPKVTFTYLNGSMPIAPPKPSVNITVQQDIQAPMYWRERRMTTTVLFPMEEVIYYPVVHNRIKMVTPELRKEHKRRKTKRSSNLRESPLPSKQAISTDDPKEPMTPQQFRKLTEWLLVQDPQE